MPNLEENAAATARKDHASRRPRPVLMIPLRRCGSHALRLRLNFHPRFYSPYPLHIVDFLPLLPLYGDLSDDRNYYQLVVDVIGLQAINIVKWPAVTFDPSEIFDAIRDEPRSVHRIVWELLLRAGERHDARVVMDKSLDSVHAADELMTLLPDLLFLNVVRDPRAQVASMNRAIIHEFEPTLNAIIWIEAHHAARALAARHPDRVLTVRYEDFLVDQEYTLKRICAFMGLEFLPEMLAIERSGEARQLAGMSDLWVSNASQPILSNKDKFTQHLNGAQIEMIETLAKEHMRYYGYEFMTAAAAPLPDAAALEACALVSMHEREAAWARLAQTNFRDHAQRRLRADYLAGLAASFDQRRRPRGWASGAAAGASEAASIAAM